MTPTERILREALTFLADDENWIGPDDGPPLIYGHESPRQLARNALAAGTGERERDRIQLLREGIEGALEALRPRPVKDEHGLQRVNTKAVREILKQTLARTDE